MSQPMQISVSDDGTTTLINVFTVDPSNQDELVRLAFDGISNIASKVPGFVRAAIHRSVDGTQLVNYIQWADADAWQRSHELLGADPHFVKHMEDVAKIATPAPRLYDVVAVVEASAS